MATPPPVRRRVLRWTGLGLVTAALAVVPSLAYAGSTDSGTDRDGNPRPSIVSVTKAPLTDLQAAPGVFDDARGTVKMWGYRASGTSTFRLTIKNIDRNAYGMTYGAHLHSGSCVAGDPAAAGPHYNTDVIAGVTPPEISAETEVWLDFRVALKGKAEAWADVPFVPQSGTRSIVIHAMPTDPSGQAGARLACLPLAIG